MTYKIQEINFCNFNLETSLQKKLSENQIIMAEESPPPPSFNVHVFRVLLCLFGNPVHDLDLIFSNLN